VEIAQKNRLGFLLCINHQQQPTITTNIFTCSIFAVKKYLARIMHGSFKNSTDSIDLEKDVYQRKDDPFLVLDKMNTIYDSSKYNTGRKYFFLFSFLAVIYIVTYASKDGVLNISSCEYGYDSSNLFLINISFRHN
jgi:short subunit fatty acids transporter